MADMVATPTERTLDSREYRREPRPKRPKVHDEGVSPPAHLPLIAPPGEDEVHTLDIEA